MKLAQWTRWIPAAFLIALMLSLTFAEAFAQRPGRRAPLDAEARAQRIESRVAYLTDQLELTDVQQVQVQEILTDIQNQRRELMAAREPGERGRIGAREEMSPLDAEVRSRMEAVLTPEQFAKYGELRARMRGDQRMRQRPDRGFRGDRPTGRMGAGQFSAIQERLELTDEQIAEIRSIVQDARAEFRADRQAGQRPDREQRVAMFQSVTEQVAEVLTEEQLEQLAELRSEVREKWQKKRLERRSNR